MRSRAHIRERDAVLRSTDAITRALLGDAWNVDAHMAVKRRLLDVIDSARTVRSLEDGTQFLGDQ